MREETPWMEELSDFKLDDGTRMRKRAVAIIWQRLKIARIELDEMSSFFVSELDDQLNDSTLTTYRLELRKLTEEVLSLESEYRTAQIEFDEMLAKQLAEAEAEGGISFKTQSDEDVTPRDIVILAGFNSHSFCYRNIYQRSTAPIAVHRRPRFKRSHRPRAPKPNHSSQKKIRLQKAGRRTRRRKQGGSCTSPSSGIPKRPMPTNLVRIGGRRYFKRIRKERTPLLKAGPFLLTTAYLLTLATVWHPMFYVMKFEAIEASKSHDAIADSHLHRSLQRSRSRKRREAQVYLPITTYPGGGPEAPLGGVPEGTTCKQPWIVNLLQLIIFRGYL